MNILWTKIAGSLKSVTVLLLVAALLVSVAFTGQGRVIATPAPQKAAEPVSADEQLVTPPVNPDQAGGKMAPDKKRGTTTTILVATPVVLNSNDHHRASSEPSFECDRSLPLEACPILGRLPNSLSKISSSLGRQFTLVGAKPDGTM